MVDDNTTRNYNHRFIRKSNRVRMSKLEVPIKSTSGDSKPILGTPIPSSPSPIRGKRPQASQPLEDRSPLMKKLIRNEKKVTLHVLLPNGRSFELTVDAASVHSVDALLDLVKKRNSQLEGELESTLTASVMLRKVEWDATDVYFENNVGHRLTNESVITTMYSVKRGGNIILLLQDGVRPGCAYRYPSLWSVTFKPEMLRPMPEGYTLDMALADQVDSALQAVWHNDLGFRRLVSVNLSPDKITIFDTGRGMDANTENWITNWGMMGASTNRTLDHNALGGTPPFLTPLLGIYGAGAAASALHLGDCATVWSKTTQSMKVVGLILEGKEIEEQRRHLQFVDQDLDQQVWKMAGGFRDMTKWEHEMAPHGSFTRVDITKLKSQYCLMDNGQQYWEVESVRRTIKNLYFCYIQVNGTNLVQTECETAILKQHTCTGDSFEFNICTKRAADRSDGRKSSGTRIEGSEMEVEVANARVICQYYPSQKGKEALETVLENLKRLSPSNSMTFEDMPRVDIRWLGRLLPNVKWVFPFMKVPLKVVQQGSDSQRWVNRVKAFVDCDAGFRPAQFKMELDLDQPFVVALRQTGSEIFAGTSALGVNVSINHNGKEMSNTQLADAYRVWLKEMHSNYDDEFMFVDDATYIFNQENALKDLGVGNKPAALIFHKHMKDFQQDWKIDDQNPIWMKLRGVSGLKVPKYVTLEYFFRAVADDDDGNKVKFLCRDIKVDAADGCKITFKDGKSHFELNSSEYFPAALLGISKRLDASDRTKKREEILSKLTGYVEVLNKQDAKIFEICEVFPDANSKFEAGFTLPKHFLVVVRPRNGSGPTFKQGMIVAEPLGIALTVTHCSCSGIICQKRKDSVISGEISLPHTNDGHSQVVCHLSARSTEKNGIKGLYLFNTESSEGNCLTREGIYTFLFATENEKCKTVDPAVSIIQICPSRITMKWTLCNHVKGCMIANLEDTSQNMQVPVIRLNEQVREDLFLQKYDQYGNCQTFETPMKVQIMCVTLKGESLEMAQHNIVAGPEGRQRLRLKNVIFKTGVLEQVRPTYEALLRVCITEEQYAETRCKVLPGALATVEVQHSEPSILMEIMCFEEALQPGEIIKNLTLQGLDSCGNKIEKGQKMQVSLQGLEFHDNCGHNKVVDENGRLQLGGLLKVACHYNSTGLIAITSDTGLTFCTIGFRTVARQLDASQPKDDCSIGISKCELKIEITQRTQQYLEDKAKILEGDLKALECRKNVVKASQEEAHDNEILKIERIRPWRTLQTVVQEMRHLAQNGQGAALAFWETQTKAPWDKDCVGLVATLAQVENDSLNRMLAEYLGPETLLMIVSRTQQTIDTLARYDADGNLDESLGLHGFAHSLGYKISGTSTALALSNTRPYRRVHGPPVNMQHPQKILNIDPPSLPDGQIPEGFLGYAVNLLYLSPDQLRISVPTQIPGAFGLRESLFFHLVGTLQVYDTRQHLISAKEKIESWQDAAISLDGGLIKTNQYEYFGKVRETVPIRFGMVPLAAREQLSLMPPACHAFQRCRAISLIDKEISDAQDTLRSFKEELDETSMHIKLLKENLNQAKILQQQNE